MSNFTKQTIEALEQGDGADLIPLLQRLAAAEGRPKAMQASAAQLEDLLFGPQAIAFGFKYRQGKELAAFTLLGRHYSSFQGARLLYLEDLVVAPNYQGRGLGRMMMNFLMDYTISEGYAGLHWSAEAANRHALCFYKHLGMQECDRISFALSRKDIMKMQGKA